jgi:large subunit ribosomal protein L2
MKAQVKNQAALRSSKPHKSLIEILQKHSGRNNTGKITVRHQGGRQKRYYRLVDFKRAKRDVEGEVIQIEYDPNRNAHIALIKYDDGEHGYILHPRDLKVGEKVLSSEKGDMKPGHAMMLKNIPIGIEVHNIELRPGQGGKMVRGAGSAAFVVAKDDRYVQIKLPSGVLCHSGSHRKC